MSVGNNNPFSRLKNLTTAPTPIADAGAVMISKEEIEAVKKAIEG